jgi:hypothetical protein
MDGDTVNIDQTDEDILTDTIPDESLEAVDTERESYPANTVQLFCCG